MNKITVYWLAIGVTLLASLACGAPRAKQANEPEPSPKAAERGQAENDVFAEDFETGHAGELTESTPSESADEEGTGTDPEIE